MSLEEVKRYMPKITFFNLNDKKKQKIEKAIKNEFSREGFEKASISNIIEEAKIPRGSFYQYFEDKEDAVKYIIDKYAKKEKEMMQNFTIKNNGNIFDMSIDIFEYIVKKVEDKKEWILYKSILSELKKNNISIWGEKEEERDFGKNINYQILNIKEKDDLKYMIRILMTITRSASLEVLSNRKSKEESKEELIKQIEILKRGMYKN